MADALTYWWRKARAAEMERDHWRKLYAALGPQIDALAVAAGIEKILEKAKNPGNGIES